MSEQASNPLSEELQRCDPMYVIVGILENPGLALRDMPISSIAQLQLTNDRPIEIQIISVISLVMEDAEDVYANIGKFREFKVLTINDSPGQDMEWWKRQAKEYFDRQQLIKDREQLEYLKKELVDDIV